MDPRWSEKRKQQHLVHLAESERLCRDLACELQGCFVKNQFHMEKCAKLQEKYHQCVEEKRRELEARAEYQE